MPLPDVFATYAAMEGAVIPDGMLDAILAEAAADAAVEIDALTGQVTTLTNDLSGRDNDPQAAKARIADLLTSAPAGIDPDAADAFDDPDDPDVADEDDADFDSMFSDTPPEK